MASVSILAFAIAFVALRVLLSRLGAFALDVPNARSLHQSPVPRTGGVAVLLGTAASLGFGAGALWLPLSLSLALAIVSFLDDLRGVPTLVRLVAHFVAAASFAWYVLSPMHPVELALLVLAIVWVTNLYNFMDGADGLAGGMAAIGFAAYAAAALVSGHQPLAAVCAALSASAAAFVLHNFHPARIFLGDVGSIPLGYLAAALGILGWRDDLWPLWFPVLVFGPFIADATVTLVKRLVRGEHVWRAHREHYYQRMVLMGLGHRRTAWVCYALMAVCASAALLGRGQPPSLQAAAFFGASALLAAAAVWIDVRWARSARPPAGAA